MTRALLKLFKRRRPAIVPAPAEPSIFDLPGMPRAAKPVQAEPPPPPPARVTRVLEMRNRFSSVEHFYHFMLGYFAPLVLGPVLKNPAITYVIRSCGPMDPHLLALGLPNIEMVDKQRWRELCRSAGSATVRVDGYDDPAFYDAAAFARLRTMILARFALNVPIEANGVLFIERGASPAYYQSEESEVKTSANLRRTVPNMAEIAGCVAALGKAVNIAELETMPLREQVGLFAAAPVLVAQHGATLVNMLWMAPGGAVIEINPMHPTTRFREYFRHLASACGHRYAVVEQASFHAPVDAGEVAAALRAIWEGEEGSASGACLSNNGGGSGGQALLPQCFDCRRDLLPAPVGSSRSPMPATLRNLDNLLQAGLVPAHAAPALRALESRYATAIPPAFGALIEYPDDPIGLQVIPHPDEAATAPHELADPTADAPFSPLPGLVHRYADRVLIKPLLICPLYCRFCFRREHVGPGGGLLSQAELDATLEYVSARPAIREVILTGGDPLMLSPRRLTALLTALDAIPHLDTLRIHTRVPVAAPERITGALLDALTTDKPLYIAVHANHAREFAAPAAAALRALVGAGAILLGQSVLLRGVNDSTAALEDLFRAMLRSRIKPYYLHQLDPAPGTARFHVPEAEGLALLAGLRGRMTGLGWPTYVREQAEGSGKIPVGALPTI